MITYTTTGVCQIYTLFEGCFGSRTCNGIFKITDASISSAPSSSSLVMNIPTKVPSNPPTKVPSKSPTRVPSRIPSAAPSPTCNPTLTTVVSCPKYTATNTNNAKTNYIPCYFTACAGVDLVISDCDASRCSNGASNDQYIRLMNEKGNEVASDDDTCSRCSKISYTTKGACQTYTLQQGCHGSSNCKGKFDILAKSGSIARFSHTDLNRIQNPIVSTDFTNITCPFYSTTVTQSALKNAVECKFSACPGNALYIRDCDDTRCPNYKGVANDQFIRLLNSTDDLVAINNDSCGSCSAITVTIQGTVSDIHSRPRMQRKCCLCWAVYHYQCINVLDTCCA